MIFPIAARLCGIRPAASGRLENPVSALCAALVFALAGGCIRNTIPPLPDEEPWPDMSNVYTLPNGDFEIWAQDDRGTWFPCAGEEVGTGSGVTYTGFWGTGNPGSNSPLTNRIVCEPSEDVRPGSSGTRSAKLISQKVPIVDIAAGNLFTGRFMKIVIPGGVVGMGRPFVQRPTALEVWYKYTCGALTAIRDQPPGEALSLGDPDQGIIYIALGDWDAASHGGTAAAPVNIDTNDASTFMRWRDDPGTIAYGEIVLDQTVADWTTQRIELESLSERTPTHIVVCGSASRWGDYFVGSDRSVLWLDDFELVY